MSISFIAIHSYILKSVALWDQNTLRGALYPTLPYTTASKKHFTLPGTSKDVAALQTVSKEHRIRSG